MTQDLLHEASIIEQQYKDGLSYKKQMGYLTKWAEYERFLRGDQWPALTERTKNLPRPVFNIIRLIQGHKVAAVMNENIKMVYSASEGAEESSLEYEAADLFTRYSDTTWEQVKQQQLNEKALKHASNRGTGIWHYYWDASYTGGYKTKYIGRLCGEIIDPVNVFPGNPQQSDVQKQPYIIITYRDLVDNIREEAQKNQVPSEIIQLIQPDKDTEDQAYDMAKQELTGTQKATVIVKYWRDKATQKIWFTKVCSRVIIKPKTNTRLSRYPIASMQWDEVEQSFFGVGDTEGLIPNQKAINFLMAMQLLSVQLTGWPKMIINKNFINQVVNNIPGEILYSTDPNGKGADYLNPGSFSNQAVMLVDKFLEYTKEVAGANENLLGEQTTSQLNATAIMLLQKAAGVPLESIKRRFYQAMEDIGRIWEDFFKNYYNTERIVVLKSDDGEEYSTNFNGSKYANIEMNLKIDIGPASSFSESLMMTSLDKLYDKGAITLEQYLKYAPRNVIPFKDRLLKEIQEQQQMQGPNIDDVIKQLPPQEQQELLSAPPELQQQIMMQIQSQMQQPQFTG